METQLNRVKNNYFDSKNRRRNSSTHSIKETYKMIKGYDEQGFSMINEYSFEKKLGEGSYGKVKLAKKKDTNEKFAIKILKKSLLKKKREFIRDAEGMKVKDALEDVMREIAIMKKLDHPNVIKLYEVIDDPETDKLFLILDYAEGGQIMEWSVNDNRFFLRHEYQENYLSEKYLRTLFRDIVKGLYYLHNNAIIHRDLKPQNILFDRNHVAKIADFGVSVLIEGEDTLNKCAGTYHFMCPEAGKNNEHSAGFSGKRADIWALGVTLFAFTYNIVPFDGDNILEICDNIEYQKLELPNLREISEDMAHLFFSLLDKNPNTRINMEEIIDHQWVNQDNTTKLRDEINTLQVEISEKDIQNAFLPLHTIVFIKTMVSRWRKRSLSRSQSPNNNNNSEANSPIQLPSTTTNNKDFKTIKPSNLSKPSPFSHFGSNLNTATRMTFEDNNSPLDTNNRVIGSPIADQLKKRFSKDGSGSGGSHSREISPKINNIFKKSPRTSPKITPSVSPLKKKLINDVILGSDEKISNLMSNMEVPEVKRLEIIQMKKESSQKSNTFEEFKKNSAFS